MTVENLVSIQMWMKFSWAPKKTSQSDEAEFQDPGISSSGALSISMAAATMAARHSGDSNRSCARDVAFHLTHEQTEYE